MVFLSAFFLSREFLMNLWLADSQNDIDSEKCNTADCCINSAMFKYLQDTRLNHSKRFEASRTSKADHFDLYLKL